MLIATLPLEDRGVFTNLISNVHAVREFMQLF
jgi:hypothetical protein